MYLVHQIVTGCQPAAYLRHHKTYTDTVFKLFKQQKHTYVFKQCVFRTP